MRAWRPESGGFGSSEPAVTLRFHLVCLLAALGAACHGVDRDERLRVAIQVDTLPSGLVTVTHRSGPEGTRTAEWLARVDLRLGDGDHPSERFGYPVHVAPGPDGMIYVLNRNPEELRVFRYDGSFSHTVDLQGLDGREGPAWGLAVLPDARVMIRDSGGAFLLSSEGSFLERRDLGFVPARAPYRGRWNEIGELVDWAVEEDRGSNDARSTWRYRPLRFSPGRTEPDSFPPLDLAVALVPGTPIPGPFHSRLMFDVSPDGNVWWAASREYRVWRRGLEGDTTLVFSMDADPVPVPEDRKGAYAAAWSPVHEIEAEHVPDTEPVIGRIVAGRQGLLYVFPNVRTQPAGRAVHVFRDGILQGRIELPTPLSVTIRRPEIVGPFIYGVTEEERAGGAREHVVRLRIEGWDRTPLPTDRLRPSGSP